MIKITPPAVFILIGVLVLSGCGFIKNDTPAAEKSLDSSTDSVYNDSETGIEKSIKQGEIDLTKSTDARITLKPKASEANALTEKNPGDPVIQKIRKEFTDEIALVFETPKAKCRDTEFFQRIRTIEKELPFPEWAKPPSDSTYSEECEVRAALRERSCQSLPDSLWKECEKLNASRDVLQEKNRKSNAEYVEILGLYEKYFVDSIAFPPSEYLN